MSKTKELAINTIIIAIGKISTQFMTFLLLPIYTAYLATGEYGTVDLILTYVSLLAPLITVQLEMGAFRFLIDIRGNEVEKRKLISSITRMIGIAIIAFVAVFIAISVIITIPYGWLVIVTILAIIVANMLLQIARGFGDNLKYSIGSMIAGTTTIISNIVFLVYLGMGIESILLAVVLGNVACAVYLFVSQKIHRYINIASRDAALERKLLKYTIPLVPNGISWWLINAADRTIITILLGLSSNGIYAIAYKFPQIFSSLFSFFGMSWTESASVNIDKKDRDIFFSQTMNASLKLIGSLGLCIISGVPLLFGLLIDAAYSEAYTYIPLLMVGAFLNSIVVLYSAIYIAKKMTKQVMNSSVVAAVVSILFTVCFIQWFGLFAPVFAMIVAYGSMAIYRHYDVKKYVNIKYDTKSFVFLFIAYIAISTLYYINHPLLNILNILIALGFSIFLNRSIVSIVRTKLFSYRRQLTPEQQVQEDIEEKVV
jgi:O-antigen/teichoic acid export membrane protein